MNAQNVAYIWSNQIIQNISISELEDLRRQEKIVAELQQKQSIEATFKAIKSDEYPAEKSVQNLKNKIASGILKM